MATIAQFAESLASIEPTEVDVVSIAPEGTPLYTILAMPGREQTVDGSYDVMGLREGVWSNGHKWFGKEVDENVKVFAVNGPVPAADNTITVLSTEGLIANAILRVKETGEQLKVVSVTNATTFEAVRGFGTTAVAGIPAEATLFFVSTTLPSGEASVDTVAVAATEVDNEIQKIVTTARQTDYEDFLKKYPGEKQKIGGFMKVTMREHAKRIERAFLLSQKKYDAATKSGTMEGILELAKRSGNVADLSAGFTRATLVAALRKPFNYGTRQVRYAICGADALDKVALSFDADKIYNDKVENASLKFSKIELPGGEEVRFVRHPDMTEANGLNSSIIVLDPEQISVVYATGEAMSGASVSGKTRVIPNTANSTYANTVVDIVTYVTLGSHNARAHGFVRV